MYNSNKHGRADYGSWMQLATTDVQSLTAIEGDEREALEEQRFARNVYVINQNPIGSVSGFINYTAPALAQYIQTSGSMTYIAEASPGTALSAAFWRCKRIEDLTTTVKVTWADGNGNFDNSATSLDALTYS